MSDGGEPRASIDELRRRIASIPDALEEACDLPLPAPPIAATHVVTTGIGGSEGPARMLASALAAGGRVCARFVPLAAYFAGSEPEADLLVVFSQGLSSNARLALESRRAKVCWVVTSVGYDGGVSERADYLDELGGLGAYAIRIPPSSEDGMLARVVGPQVASLVALRLAELLGAPALWALPFAEAASSWAIERDVPVLPGRDVALVTDATSAEWAFGLRWKLLEGLLLPDPPVWDALQLAHGPLQSFFDREMTLVVLETPSSGDLVDRVRAVVDSGRHRVERIPSRRSDALGFFDHAAALDAILLKTLEARPRDLFDWPARGEDGALYGIASPERAPPGR